MCPHFELRTNQTQPDIHSYQYIPLHHTGCPISSYPTSRLLQAQQTPISPHLKLSLCFTIKLPYSFACLSVSAKMRVMVGYSFAIQFSSVQSLSCV